MRKNQEKINQLGLSTGKANYDLHRKMIFFMAQKLGLDVCFRCRQKICTVGDLSLDHKKDWMYSEDPVGLFFDCENIAFSHKACNSGARRCNQKIKSKTGFKGVYTTGGKERDKKYETKIWEPLARRNISVGCFATAAEAAKAYDQRAAEYYGERAVTNQMLGLV